MHQYDIKQQGRKFKLLHKLSACGYCGKEGKIEKTITLI